MLLRKPEGTNLIFAPSSSNVKLILVVEYRIVWLKPFAVHRAGDFMFAIFFKINKNSSAYALFEYWKMRWPITQYFYEMAWISLKCTRATSWDLRVRCQYILNQMYLLQHSKILLGHFKMAILFLSSVYRLLNTIIQSYNSAYHDRTSSLVLSRKSHFILL